MRYAIDDSFLIGRERGNGDVGKAGSAVDATGEGQGRTAPQTFDISKVSARGLSFGVPSSGSPGAASFSAAGRESGKSQEMRDRRRPGTGKSLLRVLGRVRRTA